MKRFAFAAALVLLVGAAFSVSCIMSAFAAQETYPAGTDSVTVYGIGMAGISEADSTSTSSTCVVGWNSSTGYLSSAVVKFPLTSVPSGKSVVKVMLHVNAAVAKGLPSGTRIEVGRLMSAYDSTAVTSTRRSGSTWWASDDIHTEASVEADTTFSDITWSVRGGMGSVLFDSSPGNGDWASGDITGLVRGWYSGLWENNGILLRWGNGVSATATGPTFSNTQSANRPYLKIYYSDPSGGGKTVQGPAPFGIR